ncbi:MAG: TRAP transporter substrate-binding protein [Rhizobiales bacterium]|nr:TRAP transporter substrate-binding protein [Hyphomicrobiales bacterium]
MRKTKILASMFGALALTLAAMPGAVAQEPLKLRISGENPLVGLDLQMAQRFDQLLEEKLGDAYESEFFHTEALGDEVVHMQMIRTGQIDVYPMGSDAIQLDPTWAVFDLPFVFDSRETVAKLLDGEVGETLRKSMREKAGLEVLAFGEIGFRQITNNERPIVVPADLEGIRIRVPGSPMRSLMFETYGATPVTMNLGELYLALQQGTVDAQENPLAGTINRSFQEVQKYFSMSNHVYTPVTFAMNAAKYDSLTPEQQQAVKEAAQQAAEYTRQLGAEADEKLLTQLREGGKNEVNEIDLAAFRAASEPVYAEIAKQAGAELTQQMRDLAAQAGASDAPMAGDQPAAAGAAPEAPAEEAPAEGAATEQPAQ